MNILLFILNLTGTGTIYILWLFVNTRKGIYLASKCQFKEDLEQYKPVPLESIFSEELRARNEELQKVKDGIITYEDYFAKYNLTRLINYDIL